MVFPMEAFVASLSVLAVTVSAHGNITSPPARLPGPAMAAACGQQNVNLVLRDGTIPLESFANTPATCTSQPLVNKDRESFRTDESTGQLDLCRGALFEDNINLVQTLAAGDVVNFKAILPIPHEGPCNVSIVDTATNSAIGEPLLVFDTYADEKLRVLPANNTAFSVTMPQLPVGVCTQPGECVLQWFWFGDAAQQTYESCVDFVVG
jgi:hypothetical protein